MSTLTVSTPASRSSVMLPRISATVIFSLSSRYVRYAPSTSCFRSTLSWISSIFLFTCSSATAERRGKKTIRHTCRRSKRRHTFCPADGSRSTPCLRGRRWTLPIAVIRRVQSLKLYDNATRKKKKNKVVQWSPSDLSWLWPLSESFTN